MRFALAAAATALLPTTASAAPLVVAVHGVASAKGAVLVSVCGRADFLRKCALAKGVRAARGDVLVSFPNVPPGVVAIEAYHDENGNGRLDRTSMGIPSEGYGFSKDAKGDYGPPSFDAAAVAVPAKGRRVDVDLTY